MDLFGSVNATGEHFILGIRLSIIPGSIPNILDFEQVDCSPILRRNNFILVKSKIISFIIVSIWHNNLSVLHSCAWIGRPKKVSTEKSIHLKQLHISECKICHTSFIGKRATCSKHCLHESFVSAGKKTASTRTLRSKDEIKLFELCSTHFQSVTHNESIFNGWDADIIIYDTKTAISWNGIWHYKQMPFNNHSLLQVQNRDKIKHHEINSAGWNHLIFEDRYYTPETAFLHICEICWNGSSVRMCAGVSGLWAQYASTTPQSNKLLKGAEERIRTSTLRQDSQRLITFCRM